MKAFLSSYSLEKKINQFTKVKINIGADKVLLKYFTKNIARIEGYLEIISPSSGNINELRDEIKTLKFKSWKDIL